MTSELSRTIRLACIEIRRRYTDMYDSKVIPAEVQEAITVSVASEYGLRANTLLRLELVRPVDSGIAMDETDYKELNL